MIYDIIWLGDDIIFIDQRATEVNVLNRIDGVNIPVVYGILMD